MAVMVCFLIYIVQPLRGSSVKYIKSSKHEFLVNAEDSAGN